MRKALVFGAGVFLLFGGVSYAVVTPFQVASLTSPALPASASSYRNSPQEIMQPIQKDINPLDNPDAVPYDDGITWSWEEKVAPVDFVQFSQSLPYNEWTEIDDVTLRGLFEDVIQKALAKMEIKDKGGDFEKVLRQKLLYFVPEREYYYPPYEEDFSKRIVKFPIKVMRKKNDIGEMLTFHKGPPVDTPQLAGGRKAEIRRRRIKLLVWDKWALLGELGTQCTTSSITSFGLRSTGS